MMKIKRFGAANIIENNYSIKLEYKNRIEAIYYKKEDIIYHIIHNETRHNATVKKYKKSFLRIVNRPGLIINEEWPITKEDYKESYKNWSENKDKTIIEYLAYRIKNLKSQCRRKLINPYEYHTQKEYIIETIDY